jgi:hypothetical protein
MTFKDNIEKDRMDIEKEMHFKDMKTIKFKDAIDNLCIYAQE